MMKNIVYLASKTGNKHTDIMNMSYVIFVCYIHYLREFEQETYEQQSGASGYSSRSNSTNNIQDILHQTEPDMAKIRPYLQNGGEV